MVNAEMTVSRSVLHISLRLFSISVLILMVIVVIRLTPFPDLEAPEESCDRPCHELEWPRICRLEFTLESLSVSSSTTCANETEHCFKDELDEKTSKKLLTANRQIPGPAIHVCQHDIIVLNVENRIPDQNIAIHWRGQVQALSPLMDGVPMITQCPIPSFTSFQYKFRASNIGTHTWHLYNGQKDSANNIYGMLVVRQSTRKEVHQKLMDDDQSSHTIMLRTIKDSPQSTILINGRHSSIKDQGEPGIIFEVSQNRRYRFRVAHNGGTEKCPITGFINKHKMIIIALDGNAIEPISSNQFTIVAGERLDFILWTNQDQRMFDMKFMFAHGCDINSVSVAKLKYVDNNSRIKPLTHPFISLPHTPQFSTVATEFGKKETLGLHDVKLLSNPSKKLMEEKIDAIFYFSYGHRNMYLTTRRMFDVAHINNISFTYPSSPIASQITDVPTNLICNENKLPQNCFQNEGGICECTHVIDVEKGSVIDVVLIHQDRKSTQDHIFHLHGHKFHLLSRLDNSSTLELLDNIRNLDLSGKLKRNFEKPVLKDTVWIPAGGLAIIRFMAENAGYWMLREEESQGLALVFNVFGSHYDIPQSFPRCGNFVGPKYFLA